MSGWRAGLVALVVGGLVLAFGWVATRNGSPATSTTVPGVENPDVALACPPALQLACDGLAQALGTSRRALPQGEVPADTVVVDFAGDISGELAAQPFARSPIAVAVWGERAPTLEEACEVIDVDCLVANAGETWEDLGGPATWGTMLLGLADPTEGIADLEAWRLVAAANPGPELREWVRLRAPEGGQLLADMVLFPSRADAVVTSEAAIASQMENARARAGRLVVFYPDPAPFLQIAAHGEGRGAQDIVERLLSEDIQALLGSLGLRPLTGEATNLLRDLGTPGAEMPAVPEADKPALISGWQSVVGG
jgi:Bacterial extracellular solute-binding protein